MLLHHHVNPKIINKTHKSLFVTKYVAPCKERAPVATGVGEKKSGLAWLACVLCLALAWSGLSLSCLPCLGLVQQKQQRRRRSCRRPPKAAGCCCWTRPRQSRQDGPRPDKAKARHHKHASQECASAAWNPKGRQIIPFCHQLGRHANISHKIKTSRWQPALNFGADLAR